MSTPINHKKPETIEDALAVTVDIDTKNGTVALWVGEERIEIIVGALARIRGHIDAAAKNQPEKRVLIVSALAAMVSIECDRDGMEKAAFLELLEAAQRLASVLMSAKEAGFFEGVKPE